MRNRSIWKGALAGACGGLVASFAMNQFQALSSVAAKELSNSDDKQEQKKSSSEDASADDDATVKTAQAIAKTFTGEELSQSEKKAAGSAVHFTFGTALGAVYGALAETVPAFTTGYGTVYGSAVWLAADEIGVPAARLGPPPTETPASSHANALASHLVYGIVTDLVRRGIRNAMK